jgi:type II secretory pathway component GspD/PulD (secretin)
MKIRIRSILSLALASSVLLSGCAMPVARKVDAAIKADTQRVTRLDKKPKPIPVVAVKKGRWLLGTPLNPAPQQPTWLDEKVVLNNSQAHGINTLASEITEISGVQVLVDPSVSAAQGAATTSQSTPLKKSKTASVAQPAAQASSGGGASKKILVAYSGTMRGLLDKIAASYQLYWRPNENSVVIFRQETRSFAIPAVPMQMTGSGSISTSSSSSGSGGSSGGTSTSGSGSISESDSVSINPWEAIQSTAQAIAGAGAKAIVDKSNDLLIVTGTPPQLDHVAQWVKDLAHQMSQSILLDVEIYDISDTTEDQFAFNPSLLFENLGQRYGFSISGLTGPSATSGNPLSFGASIISPKPSGGFPTTVPSFGIPGSSGGSSTGLPGQGFTGTGGVVQALSSLAGASRVLSRSAVTLNGIPATIQAATETGYLGGTSTTQTGAVTSATTSSLQPGEVTTGFTAIMIPRLINGNIMLGMNLTLSNLLSIQTESNGTQSIQVPNVSTDGMSQVAMLKPGQTLMLSGLVQSGDQKTQNGVGTPQMQALGGGTDALHKKEHLIILVTASLVGNQ